MQALYNGVTSFTVILSSYKLSLRRRTYLAVGSCIGRREVTFHLSASSSIPILFASSISLHAHRINTSIVKYVFIIPSASVEKPIYARKLLFLHCATIRLTAGCLLRAVINIAIGGACCICCVSCRAEKRRACGLSVAIVLYICREAWRAASTNGLGGYVAFWEKRRTWHTISMSNDGAKSGQATRHRDGGGGDPPSIYAAC